MRSRFVRGVDFVISICYYCVRLVRPCAKICFNYPLVFKVSLNVSRTHFINYCLDNSFETVAISYVACVSDST